MRNKCALLVMSCDKYSSAWYPYFELIKKYWPDHPEQIYLSSEFRNYNCADLDIKTINSKKVMPWSQRLYEALSAIKEKYVVFSLEDFFLLGKVDQGAIDTCLEWMEKDQTVVECRFSTFETVTEGAFYQESKFRICPAEHPFRVDTQFALWRKSFLMKILNPIETPWQFESYASQRSSSLTEKLLWFSPKQPNNLGQMIMPYYNGWKEGYGIGWGKWRPKNREWFEANGITGVKYHHLGLLSEQDINRRCKYLYVQPTSRYHKVIKAVYKFYVYSDRVIREFLITGLQGISNLRCIMKSRKM